MCRKVFVYKVEECFSYVGLYFFLVGRVKPDNVLLLLVLRLFLCLLFFDSTEAGLLYFMLTLQQTKHRVTSFSLKNALCLLLYLLKFNLPLIVPVELMNFKLSNIPVNCVYFKNIVRMY